VAVAVVAQPYANAKLPPAVDRLLPWRWALAAVLTLLALLFLLFQLLSGFSLEKQTQEQVAKVTKSPADTAGTLTAEERQVQEIVQGQVLGAQVLRRTWQLRLSFLLLLLAFLAAVGMHWLLQRGPGRPLPRMEWMW